MNIFILDLDLTKCAKSHVDRHVVKMPLESAQMLSTAVRLSGIDAGYKITHQNHPCSIWVRSSLGNWLWLRDLAYELNEEWRYRYNHSNDCKSYETIKSLPLPNIDDIGLTKFPICMDDESKISDDPVLSYRNYYNTQKSHIFSWKNREIPDWVRTNE